MKKLRVFRTSLLFLILFAYTNLHAQAPPIQWSKTYGGTALDQATIIQATSDGGYIVGGKVQSANGDITGYHSSTIGPDDIWIIKLDALGNIAWKRIWGGSSEDILYSISQTKDGGYIACGYSGSNDGDAKIDTNLNAQAVVMKLGASGNIIWQKLLGGNGDDAAYDIRQTFDGYIMVGWTNSSNGDVPEGTHLDSMGYNSPDIWIVKLNDTGKIIWQKTYGGSREDVPQSIEISRDSGYIIGAYTFSGNGDVYKHMGNRYTSDYWILKLTATGDMSWNKVLGGTQNDMCQGVKQTPDGGYLAYGITLSNDNDVHSNHLDSTGKPSADVWLVKLSTDGNVTWSKTYGGSLNERNANLQITADSGYALCSSTYSNDGDVAGKHIYLLYVTSDMWVARLSKNGTLMWQKCMGGALDDAAYSITLTNDKGYCVAGYTASNDADVSGNHGAYDYWVVKLHDTATGIPQPTLMSDIRLFPNPTTNTLKIQYHIEDDCYIDIYDVLGKKITEVELSKSATSLSITTTNWVPGVYYYYVRQQDKIIIHGKIVRQ
ncbi:MAG: T9SS type A sorting domain-containing protein [Taibaiella sp.]|nr:T9SS type A sorting domain-containing protein [Taibaiella sp.]